MTISISEKETRRKLVCESWVYICVCVWGVVLWRSADSEAQRDSVGSAVCVCVDESRSEVTVLWCVMIHKTPMFLNSYWSFRQLTQNDVHVGL